MSLIERLDELDTNSVKRSDGRSIFAEARDRIADLESALEHRGKMLKETSDIEDKQAERIAELEIERDNYRIATHGEKKEVERQAERIAELEAENERLRKIASCVPSRDYISAKEKAGFGVRIYPQAIAAADEDHGRDCDCSACCPN